MKQGYESTLKRGQDGSGGTPKVDPTVLEIKSKDKDANMIHEFQCGVAEKHSDHIIAFTH